MSGKKRRALRFRSALHSMMAVSRILSGRFLSRDDHLSHRISSTPDYVFHAAWCDDTRRSATIPRGIGGPAVLLLFCLAPHGVFPASRLLRDAVSSYLAFSPLPALFSKNRRYLFCDTFRHRSLSRTRARVFYAACCRMVFGLSSSGPHDSPAIVCHQP